MKGREAMKRPKPTKEVQAKIDAVRKLWQPMDRGNVESQVFAYRLTALLFLIAAFFALILSLMR